MKPIDIDFYFEHFILEGIGANTFLKRLLRIILIVCLPIFFICLILIITLCYILLPFLYLFFGENNTKDD